MSAQSNFAWMRDVLNSLFDDVPRERALEAIRSGESFDLLRAELDATSIRSVSARTIPVGEYGGNLLMALVALRVKFPRDEAFAKLETNLAMRARRGGDVAG